MRPELEAALQTRWPSIFRDLYGDPAETGLAYGLRCGNGWYRLIELVCVALERESEGEGAQPPVATTIKEKFGTLRFRIADPTERQRAILAFAQDVSSLICEQCGRSRPASGEACPAGHVAFGGLGS